MDHKLKIFREVAITKSFSQASKHLHISQPAVSKTIKNLEEKYGRAFFERKSNSIELTADGRLFLEYSERLLDLYSEVAEVFRSEDFTAQTLTIAASTTLANYVMPKLITRLQNNHPELKINLLVGNTKEIQEALLTKKADLGLVEGDNHDTRLSYEKFVKDELVLVSRCSGSLPEDIHAQEVLSLPLLGREYGSGTREVVENGFRKNNLEIPQYHSVLGSTESMKTYLLNAPVYAFLSIHSIEEELKHQLLGITEVKDLQLERWFYFITRQGFQSGWTNKLKAALTQAYNQKE